jgi:hypothetical protein
MHLAKIAVVASLLATAAPACTTRTPSPAVPVPIPGLPTADRPPVRYLRFSPGIYHYRFQQRTQIDAEGSTDTVPSIISTQATIAVAVTVEADSSVQVIVSFDSISISTQGSIPSRGFSQVSTLDSIIRTRFSHAGIVVEAQLPDSLCAYSQFVSTARELLLPELAAEVQSPGRRVYRDSVSQHACRAGIPIEFVTTRELHNQRRDSIEFMLRQQTILQGAGMTRRDSLIVSGSISTHGTVSFASGNRLPSVVQTQSEGTIRVRLGSLTTNFRQTSQQEIRLEALGNP